MSEVRRIMVVTTVPQTMAAFFPRQLRMLASGGWDVHAVSAPGKELDQLGPECGITTHGVAMERPVSPLKDLKSLWRLLLLLRELRPQVVHAHTPKAGLLGMLAARLAGIPVRLYTVHGLPLMTRTGIWRRVLEAAERMSVRLSTRTYCVSPSLRQELVEMGLCPEGKAFTLGAGSCAGIDIEHFRPRDGWQAERDALGIPQAATVATFIGRLAKDKGLGVLAEAWPAVKRQCAGMHLVLAGEEDATDPVAPEVLARLRQDPTVHVTGSIPAAAMPGLFTATDICVLPTFREGLSQVALEAGAMGVPIVSSDVAGLVNSVVQGVSGILVAPGRPELLAEAIVKLAKDPSLRREMGQAGIEHVRTNFADHRINQLWLTEYQSLTSSAGDGRLPANRMAPEKF